MRVYTADGKDYFYNKQSKVGSSCLLVLWLLCAVHHVVCGVLCVYVCCVVCCVCMCVVCVCVLYLAELHVDDALRGRRLPPPHGHTHSDNHATNLQPTYRRHDV